MSKPNESGRLAWLKAALGAQKHKIVSLLGRLSDFAASVSGKPKVFNKFLFMMNEVAVARDHEVEILSEIEAVEKKHHLLREHGSLKHIEDVDLLSSEVDDFDRDLKPPERDVFWLLAFWYLLTRQKINQKKQGLTAD